MKKLFVVLFALMLVITGAASAEETLTFGTNAEFPPFEFVTAEGVIDEFDGITLQFIHLFFVVIVAIVRVLVKIQLRVYLGNIFRSFLDITGENGLSILSRSPCDQDQIFMLIIDTCFVSTLFSLSR